ncbi:regulator of G-protein signaling 14 isoform X2 [Etheostoma spectabile]|uniref:regulator of G-protein signaling 14 isoform X2 n=1 Tax=Etheostoma spectabile TaxID=54343 RepID=UPI0013AF8820|nr:regulator of G-protein signaling 14 isoform X2 [Etheostoma spectabile]
MSKPFTRATGAQLIKLSCFTWVLSSCTCQDSADSVCVFMKMVALRGLCHRFSRLAKVATQKQFRKYDKWCTITTGMMADKKSQAVSDGELNMSARGCGGSSSSLPGTSGGETGPGNSVLTWAISFEKLLEDPFGVQQFTSFLMSEVSAENILFWQACEKFRKIPASSLEELKTAARSIYNTYLSDSAPYSVNIDDTAKTEEKDLELPTPDMFNKAQAQIFKLMKMDSYRRFVRSPLYQSCTLGSVEGKLVPQLSTEPVRMGSWEDVATRSPLSNKKNKKSGSNSLPSGKSASEKQRQKRDSWGDASNTHSSVSRKESNMSVKSNSSVELGSLYQQIENGRSRPRSPEPGGRGGSRIGVEGGYCCVYLPDGSASLAPTRNGQPIKDMLTSLCEKRGFPLKDVIIYLHGKDKPLSLDQDCSVLRDQQVSLELRVTFALEITFTGKTVGIMAKSSKTLQDALSAVLQKHQLKPQEAVVTMVGDSEPLIMTSTVFRLANKVLRLEKTKGKDQTNRGSGSAAATQAGAAKAGGLESRSLLQTDRAKTQSKPGKYRDIEGLLDMLSRAQCCRVDDQRGLLTKEQLEVPLFLKLAADQGQDTEPNEQSTTSSPSASSAETPDSAESKAKDLRETSV